jgi:hypothetical protein
MRDFKREPFTREQVTPTRRRPIVAVALAIVALGVLGTARIVRGRAIARQPLPTVAIEAPWEQSDTQRQILELRGELAALKMKVAAPSLAGGGTTNDTVTPVGARAEASEHSSEKAAPPPDPEGDFRLEPVDPAWADKATAQVRSALEHANVREKVRSTECRSRICRIEIVDGDIVQPVFSQINPLLAADFPTGSSIRTIAGDGTPVTTFYFARAK